MKENTLIKATTVSYTHLDVYKRQLRRVKGSGVFHDQFVQLQAGDLGAVGGIPFHSEGGFRHQGGAFDDLFKTLYHLGQIAGVVGAQLSLIHI